MPTAPQRITVPLTVTIEVNPPPAPEHRIKVREVAGGAVLDVPKDVRRQLIEFGWLPPVDQAEDDQ